MFRAINSRVYVKTTMHGQLFTYRVFIDGREVASMSGFRFENQAMNEGMHAALDLSPIEENFNV